jgi:hypothetical protein
MEEDEDILAAFPEFDRAELRNALQQSGLGKPDERFVQDAGEGDSVGANELEGKRAISFAPSPVRPVFFRIRSLVRC